MKNILVIIFFLVSGNLVAATYYDRLLARGLGKYWLKLIHYEQNLFFPSLSRADRSEFFFYQKENPDPERELNETITAFQTGFPLVGEKRLHPQCAFPERFKLIKNLNITDLQEVDCPMFNSWKTVLRPKEISLIFKASHPQSTVEFYGEVFLKIETVQNKAYACYFNIYEQNKNYYMPKHIQRLIGLNSLEMELSDFETFIKSDPNFIKSDFYEYKLKLTAEEMDRIINHIWELKNSRTFNYYLISENRSFFTASLLQIAKDDWNLISNHKFYFTPRDVIRNLAQYGNDIETKNYILSEKGKALAMDLEKNSPELSHKNQKMELVSMLEDSHPIISLGYQAGYHGQLGPDKGYKSHSSLDFLKFNFAYDTKVKKYKIPEISLFEYAYLYPVTEGDWGWSYKGAVKKDYVEDIDLAFKSRNRAYYGTGLTFKIGGTFSLFAGLEYQYSSYTKKDDRLGPWVEWTIYLNSFKDGRILLRQKIFTSFFEDLNDAYYVENEASISLSIGKNYDCFFRNFLVTKTGSLEKNQYKGVLGLGKYF